MSSSEAHNNFSFISPTDLLQFLTSAEGYQETPRRNGRDDNNGEEHVREIKAYFNQYEILCQNIETGTVIYRFAPDINYGFSVSRNASRTGGRFLLFRIVMYPRYKSSVRNREIGHNEFQLYFDSYADLQAYIDDMTPKLKKYQFNATIRQQVQELSHSIGAFSDIAQYNSPEFSEPILNGLRMALEAIKQLPRSNIHTMGGGLHSQALNTRAEERYASALTPHSQSAPDADSDIASNQE